MIVLCLDWTDVHGGDLGARNMREYKEAQRHCKPGDDLKGANTHTHVHRPIALAQFFQGTITFDYKYWTTCTKVETQFTQTQ